MLTDPDNIAHCHDAIDKLADASEKLCEIRESGTVNVEDKLVVARAINSAAHSSQQISLLIPPTLPP